MKYKLLVITLALVCIGFKFPEPVGFVNDFADILSDSEESILDKIIDRLERETSAELAIVTVKTVQPLSIEEYSVRLFEKWGIGKKGKDNGVLLLVSVEDRAVKIEVGYGLEGVLPDGLCGEIIRKSIIPEFKMGRFGAGIIAGVSRIVSVVSGKDLTSGVTTFPGLKIANEIKEFDRVLMILFFIVIFALVSLLQVFLPHRRRYYYTGPYSWGGFGGGFGGFGGGRSGGGGAIGRW